MDSTELERTLIFLREAERLKNVYRTSWTSGGQRESVASHTWRLCLMALIFAREFEGVDFGRLVKICIVHDLGEAIGGDIPAIHQTSAAPKSSQERRSLVSLAEPLPEALKEEIVSLWDEYEAAATLEAKIAKALDKLETMLQHVQGANPPDAIDYAFNLDYGKKFTDAVPLAAEIRRIIDQETMRRDANR
jgi:putative hydrolase of HD superfamily